MTRPSQQAALLLLTFGLIKVDSLDSVAALSYGINPKHNQNKESYKMETSFAQAVKAIMAQDNLSESDAKMCAWLIGPIEAQVYIDDFNAMQNKESAK